MQTDLGGREHGSVTKVYTLADLLSGPVHTSPLDHTSSDRWYKLCALQSSRYRRSATDNVCTVTHKLDTCSVLFAEASYLLLLLRRKPAAEVVSHLFYLQGQNCVKYNTYRPLSEEDLPRFCSPDLELHQSLSRNLLRLSQLPGTAGNFETGLAEHPAVPEVRLAASS